MNDVLTRRSHALWATLLATAVMVVGAASAQAGSGGVSTPTDNTTSGDLQTNARGTGECPGSRFGERILRIGDCGEDVKTLHWILKARSEGQQVRTRPMFIHRTASAVRRIQSHTGLKRSGVVNQKTRKTLVKRMDRSLATWYGPGFWGNRTACGEKLTKTTIGVAHKTLPCGTRVTIGYHGKFVRAKVIDRGPYAHGASWDLTQATARQIGMTATSAVRAAVIR